MSQDVRSRYPGAQPFADDDLSRRLFFGRARESALLANQILAHRLVVVYGRSGLGKSSLLNAGIAKRLRVDGCLPLMLRVNAQTPDLVRSVLAAVDESARAQGFDYQPGDDSSLWHFFKTAEFWRNDVLLTPTLILDQFEELFTLQPPDVRAAFLADLGALIRGIRPAQAEGQMERDGAGALSDRAPAVRVVLSLREDFLGSLEEAADWIPQILEQRFRILPLSVEAAAEALVEPARVVDDCIETLPFEYSPEARELVLGFLSSRPGGKERGCTATVEPFQLQLICQRVEQRVAQRVRSGKMGATVTAADLGGRKGLRSTLRYFYRSQVRSLRGPLVRRRVRRLCEEFLISEEGRRLSIEESEVRCRLRLQGSTLTELVDRRLLRSDQRADLTYFELSHDTLIEPVLSSRRGRHLAFGVANVALSLLLTMFLLTMVVALFQREREDILGLLAIMAFYAVLIGVWTLSAWRRGSRALRRFGHRIDSLPTSSRTLRVRSSLLATAGGLVGAHKFYLGYYAQGILYFLVTAFSALLLALGSSSEDLGILPGALGLGLVALLGLIDGTLYRRMSDERFLLRYINGRRAWF